MSAINTSERRRHRFATELLSALGRSVIVPWPVFVEVDLVLRARGHPEAAINFADALLAGIHQLEPPVGSELELAIKLARQYPESGADLPDLVVMAMAALRRAEILTWDFRHFRSVVLRRGHRWPLVVAEHELPKP